jgi:integrase
VEQVRVKKLMTKASRDRRMPHAAWLLSLYGLRCSEILGLRWSDIDLRAKTLTINQSRVLIEYRVLIEERKAQNGKRTLPLDDELVAALTALRKHQAPGKRRYGDGVSVGACRARLVPGR